MRSMLTKPIRNSYRDITRRFLRAEHLVANQRTHGVSISGIADAKLAFLKNKSWPSIDCQPLSVKIKPTVVLNKGYGTQLLSDEGYQYARQVWSVVHCGSFLGVARMPSILYFNVKLPIVRSLSILIVSFRSCLAILF